VRQEQPLLPRSGNQSHAPIESSALNRNNLVKSGRELPAWLGLVTRQHPSGNRSLRLGISKRGDLYLRTILIPEHTLQLLRVDHKIDQRSLWAHRIKLALGQQQGGGRPGR
jgi:transposase